MSNSNGTVTFQPGGITNTAPVFNDFPTLVAYIDGLAAASGVTDWTILVDGSASAGSPSIQNGTFPLPLLVRFEALPNTNFASGYPTLSGNDVFFTGVAAVSFINFPYIQISSLIPTPVFAIAGAGQTFNVNLINSTILAGFNPFFAATNGADIAIIMTQFAVLGSAPAPSPLVLTIDTTSSASIVALDATELVGGAVTVDPGGSLGIYLVDSATISASYSSLSGATMTLLSIAPQVAYNPAVPSNWPSPPPTQVAQALDDLAARPSGGGGVTPDQFAALVMQVAALAASNTQLQSQVTTLQQQVIQIISSLFVLSAQVAELQRQIRKRKKRSKRSKRRMSNAASTSTSTQAHTLRS